MKAVVCSLCVESRGFVAPSIGAEYIYSSIIFCTRVAFTLEYNNTIRLRYESNAFTTCHPS